MIDLPDFSPLKITRSPTRPGRKQLEALDHLLVVLPEKPAASAFRGLPRAAYLERLLARARKRGEPFVTTHLDNKRATALTLAPCRAANEFGRLTEARKLIAENRRIRAGKLGFYAAGFDENAREPVARAIIRAADAAAFALPDFRSRKRRRNHLRSLKLFETDATFDLAAARSGTRGNNIARWFTALPPNKLTVADYRAAAQALARQHSMQYEFIDTTRLKRLGAGAFLAVSQGNAAPDAGIIHLSYRPDHAASASLALVGKGILFDTGGNNLKPFKGMLDMHMDMQGSAVALGTAIELASASVPFAFDAWLAVTENRVSATAYKSQDVVQAANGTTIQVIHTDAEGRMVLADTLALAAEQKPSLMIDYATLTGTCVSALTTRYSGIFSNRAGAVRDLLAAAAASGERIWPFPLDDDFDEPLRSDVADIKQCAVEGAGDHIFAARFLKRFVPDGVAWLHVDLSAGQHKGGLGAIPTEVTGFGVAFTLALLAGRDPADFAAGWSSD